MLSILHIYCMLAYMYTKARITISIFNENYPNLIECKSYIKNNFHISNRARTSKILNTHI